MSTDRKVAYLKAFGFVLLAVYGLVLARDVTVPRFLDGVDLVVHEAGHLFFRWLGEFLQVAGGTMGQLFVPAAFTVYFFLRRERLSSAVTLFWVGQNLFNISVYIKDAQTMELPLVSVGGGEDTIHDWHYLLSKLGLLRWDHAIGTMVYLLGLLVIVVSVAGGLYFSLAAREEGSDTE